MRTNAAHFAIALTSLAMACNAPAPTEPLVSRTDAPVTVGNGLSFNGVGSNGLTVNGFALNGLSFNGITHNGLSFNGLSFNGLSFNGLSFNGLSFNGLSFNGIGTNGLGVNGLSFNGLSFNGLSFNGLSFNGLSFNGLSFNGLSFNGLSFNGLSFNGAPLTAAQNDTVDAMLYHMAGCALPDGVSVSIEYVDGTFKTYDGLRGFAPEWETGPMSRRGEESVRACLESSTSTGLRVERAQIDLSGEQLDKAKVLLRYMISCALAEGDSVAIDGEKFEGGLGLAPEWKDSAPTAAGQRRVSACLAARANANGQSVAISLRGAGASVGQVEKAAFTWHEGGFWADLFGSEPYIRTCSVGGGISGRVCTDPGGCGFDDVGACASACDSTDGDGAYSSCGAENDTYVINTYMNLGTTMAFYDDHACYKNGDGELWCWGFNSHGELGTGVASTWGETEPVPTVIPRKVRSVAAGDARNCAVLDTGELWCWGDYYGAIPESLGGLGADVAQVSHGRDGACALKTDSSVWCWGTIGDPFSGFAPGIDYGSDPVHVMDGAAALSASGWENHTCAITGDGVVWCWGQNLYGAASVLGTSLSLTEPTQASSPSPMPGLEMTNVCAGENHTCARTANGHVDCWGSNFEYQLGIETLSGPYPYVTAPIANVAANGLACGSRHTCVLKTDGTVWCWGLNSDGQLGDGTLAMRADPFQVRGTDWFSWLEDVVELIPGTYTTCARTSDGSIYCWGDNAGMRLGDPGYTYDYSALPVRNTNVDGLPICGDGVCDASETATSCDADCCDAAGTTRSCGDSDTGACQLGTQTCSGGAWSACAGEVGPSVESCGDGLDNDCDGNEDEDCDDPCFAHAVDATGAALTNSCGTCTADVCAADAYCCTVYWDDVCVDLAATTTSCCAPGDTDTCGSEVGACALGSKTCLGTGDWDICEGANGPSGEVCDGLDNDCDGETDEMVCGGTDLPLYQPIASGLYRTGYAWNYNMGYEFKAEAPITVTALGGRFSGTKTVRLYDRATGAELASATVTASYDWSYTDIPPVALEAGKTYSVAVYIGGSGGSYYSGAALPATAPGVSNIQACYRSGSVSEPCSYRTVTSSMYGVADVRYQIDTEPKPPPAPPNLCEGSCGGQTPAGCWCDSWCSTYGDCCQDASGSQGASTSYMCEACEGSVSGCY